MINFPFLKMNYFLIIIIVQWNPFIKTPWNEATYKFPKLCLVIQIYLWNEDTPVISTLIFVPRVSRIEGFHSSLLGEIQDMEWSNGKLHSPTLPDLGLQPLEYLIIRVSGAKKNLINKMTCDYNSTMNLNTYTCTWPQKRNKMTIVCSHSQCPQNYDVMSLYVI